MSIRNLQHLSEIPDEQLCNRQLSDFDRARIYLLRGDIFLPKLDAEAFDEILDTLHLSYHAAETLTGISAQRLMRYRKENRFPAEVALLLTILKHEKENFFSHFDKAQTTDCTLTQPSQLVSSLTKESTLAGRLFEINIASALRSGSDATVNTVTTQARLNQKPFRFRDD